MRHRSICETSDFISTSRASTRLRWKPIFAFPRHWILDFLNCEDGKQKQNWDPSDPEPFNRSSCRSPLYHIIVVLAFDLTGPRGSKDSFSFSLIPGHPGTVVHSFDSSGLAKGILSRGFFKLDRLRFAFSTFIRPTAHLTLCERQNDRR